MRRFEFEGKEIIDPTIFRNKIDVEMRILPDRLDIVYTLKDKTGESELSVLSVELTERLSKKLIEFYGSSTVRVGKIYQSGRKIKWE